MTIKMVLSISIAVIVLGSIVGIILNSNEKLSENNLRIAYFPNIGHAIPIVGMEKGFFQKKLILMLKYKVEFLIVDLK